MGMGAIRGGNFFFFFLSNDIAKYNNIIMFTVFWLRYLLKYPIMGFCRSSQIFCSHRAPPIAIITDGQQNGGLLMSCEIEIGNREEGEGGEEGKYFFKLFKKL